MKKKEIKECTVGVGNRHNNNNNNNGHEDVKFQMRGGLEASKQPSRRTIRESVVHTAPIAYRVEVYVLPFGANTKGQVSRSKIGKKTTLSALATLLYTAYIKKATEYLSASASEFDSSEAVAELDSYTFVKMFAVRRGITVL
ncbi:hypothetical protein BDP27DRAFT_1372417 [Rhodocollybia butyracea]|uniref:Uncharacterized protein n=1 Tax=Rhodocollybia butyracea TaxID=206335 RepID=A0A9P5P5D6_9AGAR|nr:hypothetical protein BDP27DRAFT_1372417 [Rhodocollybia butyracea]